MKLVQKYCDLPILPLPMIHRLSCSENFLLRGVITGFLWLDKAYMYRFGEIRGETIQDRIPFKEIEIRRYVIIV